MGSQFDKRLLVGAFALDMLVEYIRQNPDQYSQTAGYSYCRFHHQLRNHVSLPSSH